MAAQRPPVVRVEPGPGFSLQYNVGGVGGLHLATCLFSEAVEERLFLHPALFPFAAEAGTDRRTEEQLRMEDHPPEFFAVVNAVRDSGLAPDLVQPNVLLSLSYPTSGARGARFQCHYDSRYRWGEVRPPLLPLLPPPLLPLLPLRPQPAGRPCSGSLFFGLEPGTQDLSSPCTQDVLGVSLGAGSTLRMVPDDKTRPNVEIELPRRSV